MPKDSDLSTASLTHANLYPLTVLSSINFPFHKLTSVNCYIIGPVFLSTKIIFNNIVLGDNKIADQIKECATKPKDLSLLPT